MRRKKYVLEGKALIIYNKMCNQDLYYLFVGEGADSMADVVIKDGWEPNDLSGKKIRLTLEIL